MSLRQMSRGSLRCLLAGALWAAAAGAAGAQAVSGRLLEGESKPVVGALVLLVDGSGREVSGALTDGAGAFAVRAPRPGRFQLRAQRVGYESTLTRPFELAEGEALRRDIVATMVATRIDGITVAARNPCDLRPAAGRATSLLWEEARKALQATAFAQRESLYRFRIRTFSRRLDPRSLQPLPDSAVEGERTLLTSRPFASIPTAQLLDRGFVEQSFTGSEYYAPDAEVLLSEPFLNEYCFAIAESAAEPALVGLTFRPVAESGPPAVRGTLWLDRASRQLRRLDFGYTRLDLPGGAAALAGGRIEFEALPAGAWIVKRWGIRMPTRVSLDHDITGGTISWAERCGPACFRNRTKANEDVPPRFDSAVTGLLEQGGEVVETLPLRSEPLAGTLAGEVYDSVHAAPLAGAIVYLSGTQYTATTDSAGRFELHGVPPGSYALAFSHPRLARLGFFAPPVPVEMAAGAVRSVVLALREDVEAGAVGRVCPTAGTASPSRPAAMLGRLTDEETGAPLAGAEVRVGWGASGRGSAPVIARTDADGSYLACGLAAGRPLTVQVRREGRVVLERALPGVGASRVGVLDAAVPAIPIDAR